MSKSKFIDKIQSFLHKKVSDKKSKKEKIKILLDKLHVRHKKLKKELNQTTSKDKKQDLKESIAIIKKQIKKGELLLK